MMAAKFCCRFLAVSGSGNNYGLLAHVTVLIGCTNSCNFTMFEALLRTHVQHEITVEQLTLSVLTCTILALICMHSNSN